MSNSLETRNANLDYFNWRFLVYTGAFGIVAVIFLFYFNRLVALVLFGAIRAYTWLFYRIHVRCQAVQVSLLGGRVFFRGLEYHGENETIVCHQAYITWRYWYRRVADVDLRSSTAREGTASRSGSSAKVTGQSSEREGVGDRESGQRASRPQAPCRISVHVRGLEWFVYNRSPSFDAIIAAAAAQQAAQHQESHKKHRSQDKTSSSSSQSGQVRDSLQSAGRIARPPYQPFAEKPQADAPFFLNMLPIHVECTKAAMVMGNQHTRSVMVAKIDRATGQVTASSSGLYDKYRQHFDFEIFQSVMRFCPNEDYEGPLLTTGVQMNGIGHEDVLRDSEQHESRHHKRSRHRARQALSKLIPSFQRSVQSFERRSGSIQRDTDPPVLGVGVPGESEWIGLTRYLDEEEEDKLEHERWRRIEYAEEQVIADCPKVKMDFYWDVPGSVPHGAVEEDDDPIVDGACEVNGSGAPAWGLELRISGGKVNYGPWADRQRIDLMLMFFPSAYADAVPAVPLRPGQTRMSTQFKIVIIVDDRITLRLQTREPSKDWKHRGSDKAAAAKRSPKSKQRQAKSKKQTQAVCDPHDRPAGWLDVSFEADTAVSYNMDMMASELGFKNLLSVDVVSPIITSSVDADVFLKAADMTVSCDLSNPLRWNAERTWAFKIASRDPELFMLREHAFLIQDLVEDFTTGPSAEYYTFIPFRYALTLSFENFKIHLNANDLNIIDKPVDLSDNNFLILQSQKVVASVGIPATQLNPVKNSITFDGHLSNTVFRVNTPTWNTYNTLLKNSELGQFPEITAQGSYNYFASTSPAATDTLLMQIHGSKPKLYLYGFLIRHFMTFRENYFGEDVHFQTIEEYQRMLQQPGPGRKHAGDNDHKPAKPSSDLDVILSITTKDPCILLPSKLYSSEDCVKIDMESGSADLRFTNYYMDLQTTLSPLSLSHVVSETSSSGRDASDIGVQTFVDGVSIVGHRLFGLPPTEPTYVCHWDFDVGEITGEASIEYLGAFISGVQCLIYGLDDAENALPIPEASPLDDVTFLRASVKPAKLWLHVDQLMMLCEIGSARVEFNDWSRNRFSERLHVVVPNIVLAAIDGQILNRHRGNTPKTDKALTFGYLQTSIDVRMVSSKANFREAQRRQQDHIRLHDARTTRTPWLLHHAESTNMSQYQPQLAKLQPPASPFPPMPSPVPKSDAGRIRDGSDTSSLHSDELSSTGNRQSSFLLRSELTKAGNRRPISNVVSSASSQATLSSQQNSIQGPQYNSRRAENAGSTKVTLSSSYERPYFPLLHIQPSEDDLPAVMMNESQDVGAATEDTNADDIPLEDDEMEHMTLMIALDTGLRVVCTPPALRSVNTLLATVQNRSTDSLLDALQMQSLGAVVAKKKQQNVPKITQLRLQVPGLAIRFRHHCPIQLTSYDKQQTYEIAMMNLLAVARFGAEREEPLGKTPSSLQASLEKLELEARRTTSTGFDEARVLLKLTDLTSWLYESEENTGELKYRTLEVASFNQKIEHLAGLVNSAGTLANSLGREFMSTFTTQSARLQTLVHTLTDVGQHVADPELLSSASFVSRRWEEVVRTSDSWKMMMRLRWILQDMDMEAAETLDSQLSGEAFDVPSDAVLQVVDKFTSWRSWDLNAIRSSALICILYGNATPAHQDKGRKRGKPVQFAFISGITSLVIDPGKRRNKFFIEGLGAAIESDLRMSGSNDDIDIMDHLARKTTIEVTCERSLFELKLELLDAVKDIFEHVKKIKSGHAVVISPQTDDGADFVEQQVHVVLAVKRNDVRVRSRHLKAVFRTDQFAASIAGIAMAKDQVLATALMTAVASTTTVRTAAKSLISILAKGPSIYGNLDNFKGSASNSNKWKIGAQCHRIELNLLDSALGLLGVADQVIGSEMTYLRSFISQIDTVNDTYPAQQLSTTPTENSFKVTLQLSSYCITMVMFSSLRYRLEGRETRSSFMPDTGDKRTQTFEFDVRDHAHIVFNVEDGIMNELSRLELPPINGKVALKQIDPLVVDVSLVMSKIALDASAVHGLFNTLSRDELTRFGENVIRDAEIVKTNYEIVMAGTADIQSPTSPTSPVSRKLSAKAEKPTLYSASIQLAGIAILATSSKSFKTSAELTVDSGPIHFAIRNNRPVTGAILTFPELEISLDEIGVILESLHQGRRDKCGSVALSVSLLGTSEISDRNQIVRAYHAVVASLAIDVYTETASMIIDILGYLQQRFKHFNLNEELSTLRARRRRRAKSHREARGLPPVREESEEDAPVALFDAIFTFQLRKLQAIWHVGDGLLRSPIENPENLVFSVQTIDLRTKKGNTARLEIKDLQLQMSPTSQPPTARSKNSALMPEVVFKVAYLSRMKDRRVALQAFGKALDLRLTSQFIVPAVNIQKSIAIATQDLRQVLGDWNETLVEGDSQHKSVLGDKKLASLTVDADFAGARVYMEGKEATDPNRKFVGNRGVRAPHEGKYGQFAQADSRSTTTLETPGLAFRVEYTDTPQAERRLNGELKVAASSNILRPMFVPLVLEVIASVKDIVGESPLAKPQESASEDMGSIQKPPSPESTTDPTAILGDCKLNLGLRICQQSFSLTCEPIARVTATAKFQDIYISVSTVQPEKSERFFAVSSAISGLDTTVQHVYSRESTGRFTVDTIHLSLMNSKHFSGMTGVSSILNISPMKVFLNVKQLQDFLLFREIWYPVEIRPVPQAPTSGSQPPVKGGVQRYQQVTASNAFSWNAAIHIAGLHLSLDLGQAVGKLSFSITRLWITSRKNSESEQNLCLGFDAIGMESTGRMSGSIELRNLRVRTNIVWPEAANELRTPLVQASLGFDDLRAKASFDYQAFAIADFQSLSFLLYNVTEARGDRLVCTVNGDKIQAYCTANAAAQGVALYQAINRLIEEKQAAFETSLKEMERFQRQKAAAALGLSSSQELSRSIIEAPEVELAPVRLQVNVVVSLNALRAGVYPRAFRDNQIFKLEALDALARFGVSVGDDNKVHTLLTVVLGQLRVALSTVDRTSVRAKTLGDNVSIDDVVKSSTGSRGGTILKVPRVVATMQTWQVQASKNVEYLFRSTFEGKVEVGWNYSRISFIRGMWDMHSKALVQRLGKLPQSAVQITSSPRPDSNKDSSAEEAQEKITAVVNVPLSKYIYEAREPPIIQTPQLRDMGEATPPLEWIGLQRDKLPNLTHQVVIVPLLEFSKEVEDAYSKILGAS